MATSPHKNQPFCVLHNDGDVQWMLTDQANKAVRFYATQFIMTSSSTVWLILHFKNLVRHAISGGCHRVFHRALQRVCIHQLDQNCQGTNRRIPVQHWQTPKHRWALKHRRPRLQRTISLGTTFTGPRLLHPTLLTVGLKLLNFQV